jgi:hypothetical protein
MHFIRFVRVYGRLERVLGFRGLAFVMDLGLPWGVLSLGFVWGMEVF